MKPLCQTDAGTELIMGRAANHLSSKHASIPIASRPISVIGVKHMLQLLQDNSPGATNVL